MPRSVRAHRWAPLALIGFAAIVLASHGAAPRPRAKACGACICAETQMQHVLSPTSIRDVPLNARVFVRGDVSAETVVLRDGASGEPVSVAFEPAGGSGGLWLTPHADLAPSTEHAVEVAGEPVRSFETGTATDEVAPAIAEVTVDPDGGSLTAVCGAKTGVALRITPAGDEHFGSLVQLDLSAPDGSSQRLFLHGAANQVAFGRWQGDPEAWGGNCLGDADVAWLDADTAVDVDVTIFDQAGNASEPVGVEGVTAALFEAPGCPGEGDTSPSAGCSVTR